SPRSPCTAGCTPSSRKATRATSASRPVCWSRSGSTKPGSRRSKVFAAARVFATDAPSSRRRGRPATPWPRDRHAATSRRRSRLSHDSRLSRASLTLRATAVLFAALGVIPVATILTPGVVPWWDAAVREWLLRGPIVALVALALALLLPTRVDALLSSAHALVLRPSARAFAAGVAVCALMAAVAVAWY